MSRLDDVLARIDADTDAALERLFAVLRIKSISTDPAYAAECRACADWHVSDLRSIGFDYFIVSNATAGVPREARHRMMRRFSEEVVPIVARTPVPEEPAIPSRAAE